MSTKKLYSAGLCGADDKPYSINVFNSIKSIKNWALLNGYEGHKLIICQYNDLSKVTASHFKIVNGEIKKLGAN